MTTRQNQCHEQLARIGPKRKRKAVTSPTRGHWDKLLRGPRGLVEPQDFMAEADDDSFSKIEVKKGEDVQVNDVVHVNYPLSGGQLHSYQAPVPLQPGETYEERFGENTYWEFTPTGFVRRNDAAAEAEAKWLLELRLTTKPVVYGRYDDWKLVFTLKPKR